MESLSVLPPPLPGFGEPSGKTKPETGGGSEAGKGRASLPLPRPPHSCPATLLLPAANNGSAMVRVISVSTSERTLLKGFTGSVADLTFAHLNSSQLACLDEAGNLFVWRLALVNGKIQYPFPGVRWGLKKGGWSWGCQTHLIIHLSSP